MSNRLATIPLGHVADIVMGQSPDSANCNTDELGLPFLQGCAEFGLQHPSANIFCFPPLRVAKTDSILISVRAPVGKTNWGDQNYCIGRGLGAISAKSGLADTLFLKYSLDANAHFLHRRSQGSTFLAIGSNDLKIFPVPDFSFETQTKIASILSTIDQTIEKTEALIGKYQQIKAGLMHDLFTRGVTADGKLRPAREQAPELYQETTIGWIPKDWALKPLHTMADIVSGVTLSSKISPDQRIEVPYLRVANVQDGFLDLRDVKTIKVNQKTYANLLLKDGDVLMNEGGDFDKLGRGTVWHEEIEPCIHQNHVFRVRTNQMFLLPYYLAYWSESNFGKKYFILSSKQSTNLASINSTQLKAYPIGVPCKEEQLRIEERLKTVVMKIRALEVEKEKFYQQKSGLMNDLLSGKVEVKTQEPEAAHV